MSACMRGTRGSGVLFNTGDLLVMIVVRGVGGVCDMCLCLARGGVGGERGEWMRELGLGFTNPVGKGGVLDVCLYFGCGGVGSVDGESVGALTKGGSGGVVLCLCEVGVWILCVDGRSRYLCIVLGGCLHILGAPCCTLWISAF